MKWFKNLLRRFCEWNIIMSKTTITSLDLMDDIKEMNKSFKSKIDNPANVERK